jgi:hypothetical protein
MKKIDSIFSKVLFAVALLVSPAIGSSQNYFQKTYATTYDKTSRDILPTSDGGYIIAGSTNTTTVTDCDVFVMKTDASGNLLWSKQFGGNKPDYTYAMCETSDGNYFITGYSESFSGGDQDVYLIKMDPSGNLLWQKTYGSWGNDEGREIIHTSDDNYVIVGTMGPATGSLTSQDAFLIKIDLSGTILWQKYYGGSNKEYGNSVKQCSDGGYILTGQTLSWGQNGDTYIVRTNSSGDTLWTKMHSSPLADEGVWVTVNADDSFAFAIRDSSSSDVDVRILKLDANGGVVWDKLYGSTDKDTPKSICTTADGGYLVGAISRSFGWVNPDMWLLKLNASGDTLWSRHFGSSDHEHCHKAKEWDNGYIAVGHSRSYGPGQKVMFVKMNTSGAIVAGLKENSIADNFNVYPNPTSNGRINIDLNSGLLKLRLSNALGEVVFERSNTVATKEEEIDLGIHKDGVYLLNIETEKGTVNKKIIIGL